jgi:hypothetical protein
LLLAVLAQSIARSLSRVAAISFAVAAIYGAIYRIFPNILDWRNSAEIGVAEHRAAEVCSVEVRFAQIRAAQESTVEVRTVQVRLTEIRAHRRVRPAPRFPGVGSLAEQKDVFGLCHDALPGPQDART